MKACIFCQETKLYIKSPTQYQCATCKRTWSEEKYHKEYALLDAFLNNESILEATHKRGIHYSTGKHVYQKLRLLITQYAQECYGSKNESFSQYDEYYYLPKNKKKDAQYVFDSVGIFGMLYDAWVYTLLLPDQLTAYKRLMAHDEVMDHETYTRYLNAHKVVHIKSFEHRLAQFWRFFEHFMASFKGVRKENLVYYLKEAEFKFNYSKEEQRSILTDLWRQNM